VAGHPKAEGRRVISRSSSWSVGRPGHDGASFPRVDQVPAKRSRRSGCLVLDPSGWQATETRAPERNLTDRVCYNTNIPRGPRDGALYDSDCAPGWAVP
jgi:hypothetical protein